MELYNFLIIILMIFIAVGIGDSLALAQCAHPFILCLFGDNSATELVVLKTVVCYSRQTVLMSY
jgi:hypothetical protein